MEKGLKNGEDDEEIQVSKFQLSPKPIREEIFCRTSAIDLMQCKLVCKSWYEIINKPYFAKEYSKKSPFTTFIYRNFRKLYNEEWYLVEFSENGEFTWKRIKPAIPDSLRKEVLLTVRSCCNGLLCLSGKPREADPQLNFESVGIISNPVSGESFTLPGNKIDKEECIRGYRIGFVPSINRFKVVKFSFGLSGWDKLDVCQIFTIGVDENWRDVESGFISYSEATNLPCVSGVFHWIPMDDSLGAIYNFDLMEEKIGKIVGPPGLVINQTMKVDSFRNQLYLFDKFDADSFVTIWTMQKIGITESWTKYLVLRSWFPSSVVGIKMVGKSRNGDLFFVADGWDWDCSSFHTFYRVKDGKCSDIGFLTTKIFRTAAPLSYEPSFMSLEEYTVKDNQE